VIVADRNADQSLDRQSPQAARSSQRPPSRQLEQVLGGLLGASSMTVERTPNAYKSSFATEVVTCHADNGEVHRLFCKYGPTRVDSGHGHRGGVAYESAVYRDALEPAGMGTPRLRGIHEDRAGRRTWLIIEHLAEAGRLLWYPEAMGPAAAWIGRFHATMQLRVDAGELDFLRRYDEDYFAAWAPRADALVSEAWKQRFAWWPRVCERFGLCVELLLEAPATVIHGEYYPKNVLCTGEAIHPVDWESAAVAPGEIDLASLVEGWPAEIARECIECYRAARWPAAAPAEFERVLDAARVYFALRWLGDHPALTEKKSTVRLFEELGGAARRLGLIT
jgi:hypothetical protein